MALGRYLHDARGVVARVRRVRRLRREPAARARLPRGDSHRLGHRADAAVRRRPRRGLAAPLAVVDGEQLQALLYGNAACAINRTVGGELLELLPLEPDSFSVISQGRTIAYRTVAYGVLSPEQVFHLRAPGISPLWGDSPIGLCRTSIQTLATQERMALESYANGGNPKLAIVHPRQIGPELMQAMEEHYTKKHAGPENAGRPIVLGDGVKVERISSTMDDTGLASARDYSIDEVCRIFGVPGLYLGKSGGGNAYGSLEWAGRQYVDACLSHWLAAWSAEIEAKLCAPGARASWDTDALTRPGIAEQMAALRTGVEAGVITRNEAREWLDLAPLPGLDEPTLALNVGTGGGATNIGSDTSEQAGAIE
jgi:HK97 family phage portal protein